MCCLLLRDVSLYAAFVLLFPALIVISRVCSDADSVAAISAPAASNPYAAFLSQMDDMATQQADMLRAASSGSGSRNNRRGRNEATAAAASRLRHQWEPSGLAQPQQPPAQAGGSGDSQGALVTNPAAAAAGRTQPALPSTPQQAAEAREANKSALRRFVSDGAALGQAANIATRPTPPASDPYAAFHLVRISNGNIVCHAPHLPGPVTYLLSWFTKQPDRLPAAM